MRKLKPGLLLIGGSGRNVGKTTFATELIKKFSKQHSETHRIIGLKVSTFRSNEDSYHGDHQEQTKSGFLIKKEDLSVPHKDTAQMVIAGAETAYYIQTSAESVAEAYQEFETSINPVNLPVVCESRALLQVVRPGLFIMVVDGEKVKPDTASLIKEADHTLYFKKNDLSELHRLVEDIQLTEYGWKFNNK